MGSGLELGLGLRLGLGMGIGPELGLGLGLSLGLSFGLSFGWAPAPARSAPVPLAYTRDATTTRLVCRPWRLCLTRPAAAASHPGR